MRYERLLNVSAKSLPDKIAVVDGTQRISYALLHAQVDAFAASLTAIGFRRDDRCVIFLDNSWQAVVAIFGVLRAGGVFSVINPTMKIDKLAFVLNDCEASILVTHAALAEVAIPAAAQSASVKHVIAVMAGDRPLPPCIDFQSLIENPSQIPPSGTNGIDQDLAMLVYTSGSTGRPKGVMMTHANMLCAAQSITEYLENTPDDIILSVLPLSFDYGLYQLLMSIMVGATLVLERSFAFPASILAKLASERVTGFPLVPTMAALIVQYKGFKPEWSTSVRYLTNTAAALPPAHIGRLQQLFPSARVYSMYGVTESKRCTYLPPAELERRPSSVGVAIPNTEVWVADADGLPAAPGQVGELVVRGGHVMKGYWRNVAATDAALHPGKYPWEKVLHTGDLFRMDDDGFFYFVGRKDDIIKSRGEKVAPKEIENVLYSLPAIREAAIVGIPDSVLGNRLKAVVALQPGSELSAADIIAHCRAQLEPFMVPQIVEFRDELPKTSTGKIRRATLQSEANEASTDAGE